MFDYLKKMIFDFLSLTKNLLSFSPRHKKEKNFFQEYEKNRTIWFNGKFVGWERARIHVLAHSLHYGSAVFEGIRAYPTKRGVAVFRLPDHIDRLFYSASVFEMEIPFSKEKIGEGILKTIKINQLKECYIRPIAFFGEKMGLNPRGALVNLAIPAFPWKGFFEKKKISVKISKFIRIHPRSTLADAKISGHYVNSILASLEKQKKKVLMRPYFWILR